MYARNPPYPKEVCLLSTELHGAEANDAVLWLSDSIDIIVMCLVETCWSS